jgi:PleD family two-component response regulator
MRQKNLPITISMGVVVCQAPPHSVENLVDMADELMYEVKNSTKNNTLCAAWDGQRFHKVDCGFA